MANIIAHRGARAAAPQNTIAAFKKAIELGANGLENDVHLTKDGKLVVCHNHTIDETSNGNGYIDELTFDELRKLDFGSYFSEDFAGEKIPSLEEFLDVCDNRIEIINIEIKEPRRRGTGIARKTIETVKSFGLFDRLLISSFSDEILVECKGIDPKTKTGFLYSPDDTKIEEVFYNYVKFAQSIKAEALHPMMMLVNEEYVENCHKNGIEVNPWTVNKDFTMEYLLSAGCDGLITDVPDVAKAVMASV